MKTFGTPNTESATKIVLLGSGELGKEVALEAQRFGMEVIAVDRYANAPAMQVAHRSHVIPMLDGQKLRAIIEEEKPHLIVPEIEAIATDTLVELESEGFNVIPTARAARLTMDREGIRRFAAEELDLKTSPYAFADTEEEYRAACTKVGFPCVLKPVMSSSGRGQSVLRSESDVDEGWRVAQEGARGGAGRVIVEGFVDFDYEITLLTLRHSGGTSYVDPIGHRQVEGDYHESWQPQPMSPVALEKSQQMAKAITDGLGGYGIFGVELFIKGDDVWFSEVHARAILGLPVPNIRQYGPAASYVILGEGESNAPSFENVAEALQEPDTAVRLFGKPEVRGERRLGVALALGDSLEHAREKAKKAASTVQVKL